MAFEPLYNEMKTMRTGILAGVGALVLFAAAPPAFADGPGRTAHPGNVRMDAAKEMCTSWLLMMTVGGGAMAMGVLGMKQSS